MLRVKIDDNGGCDVVYLGLDIADIGKHTGVRETTNLPKYVQQRLAILMTCDPTPPTFNVEGVGRRLDEHTFWIFPEEVDYDSS